MTIDSSAVSVIKMDEMRAVEVLGKSSMKKIKWLYSNVMNDGAYGDKFIGRVKSFEGKILNCRIVISETIKADEVGREGALRHVDRIAKEFCYDLSEEMFDSNIPDLQKRFSDIKKRKSPIGALSGIEGELKELCAIYESLGKLDEAYINTLADFNSRIAKYKNKHRMELEAVHALAVSFGVVSKFKRATDLQKVFKVKLGEIAKDIKATKDLTLLKILNAELEGLEKSFIKYKGNEDLFKNLKVARESLEKKVHYVLNSDNYRKGAEALLNIKGENYEEDKELLFEIETYIKAMKALKDQEIVCLLEFKKKIVLTSISEVFQEKLTNIEGEIQDQINNEERLLEEGIKNGYLNSMEESLEDLEKELRDLKGKYSEFIFPERGAFLVIAAKEQIKVLREKAIRILMLNLNEVTSKMDKIRAMRSKERGEFFVYARSILKNIKEIVSSMDDIDLKANPKLLEVEGQMKRLERLIFFSL